MNSFFASVEQQANPYIRNKPVAVVGKPNYAGSAILAASYPAKDLGIGLSTRLGEAKKICPELIAIPIDFIKYYSVNSQIVKILREEAPIVEVYSIDEAFMDVTDICSDLYEANKLAIKIKHRINSELGESLTSSVGISHNKLLAKIGSNYKKPDAITVIPWDDRLYFLDRLRLDDIWGIGRRSSNKLNAIGVRNTSMIRTLSDHTLRNLVGSYYTRLKLIANGEYYEQVNPERSTRQAKSMQHAHTLHIATNDKQEILSLLRKLSEKLGRRLRRHEQETSCIQIGIRPANQQHYGWGIAPKYFGEEHLYKYTNSGKEIYHAAKAILSKMQLENTLIRLVSVGVTHLQSTSNLKLDLSEYNTNKQKKIDAMTDIINSRYGEFTIKSGDITYQFAKERELSVFRENMAFHPDS